MPNPSTPRCAWVVSGLADAWVSVIPMPEATVTAATADTAAVRHLLAIWSPSGYSSRHRYKSLPGGRTRVAAGWIALSLDFPHGRLGVRGDRPGADPHRGVVRRVRDGPGVV